MNWLWLLSVAIFFLSYFCGSRRHRPYGFLLIPLPIFVNEMVFKKEACNTELILLYPSEKEIRFKKEACNGQLV